MSNGIQGQLPAGWAEATLGDVRHDRSMSVLPGRTPSEIFELYSVPSHSSGNPEILSGEKIGSNKQTVEPDTVLLCKINPRINRVWVVGNYSIHRKIASTEWIPFFPVQSVLSKYLCYYMQQNGFRDYLATRASGVGGSLMRVKGSIADPYRFPLAPQHEQAKIVAEIEKHFARLDAAVAALRRIQANLKRYRASVLKAACEGHLVPTEAELARHEVRNYEPADRLIAEILKERRVAWENQSTNASKKKYVEPLPADTSNLPHLPEGWIWASVEQLGMVQLGRQRSPKNRSKDHPVQYLRAANITEAGLNLSDVYDMEFSPEEQERYRLRNGDLVLSEASGSADQVGKPAVWRDQLPICCFQNTVIRLRPVLNLSNYLVACFKYYYASAVFAKVASGVGINHLSAQRFSRVVVPLAPLYEQRRIVAEVERRLSVVDELESIVAVGMKRAERLRQAILKRAFEGKLVPQDPNDEPAGALLERICAERAKAQQARASRGERSRRTTSRGQRTKAEL